MSKRRSAKNRNGKGCGAWALTGTNQCALHADPERAAVMGSKHGRSVTLHFRPDVLDLPHRPLNSAEEICGLLEETINLRGHALPLTIGPAPRSTKRSTITAE